MSGIHRISSLKTILKINRVFLILAIFLIASACDILVPFEADFTPPPPSQKGGAGSDWYTIYFSEPEETANPPYVGGPDEALAQSIQNARVSVDTAMHFLNLWSIRDALLDANRRGIKVRIVTETDNLDVDEIQQLIAAGIPVVDDRREGRMHNKFVVIDRQEVWTGSMNLSVKGVYFHDNNLVRINSPIMADDFMVEFEEMFVEDRFGPGSPANTTNPVFSNNGFQLETYFSPEDSPSRRIIELIDGAENNIYFMAYSFTSNDIADALIEQAQRGVAVRGVFDRGQTRANAGTEFTKMRAAGIDVRLDGNKNKMHHKVMIIDEQVVITGSYNFSLSAERINDENVIVLHNRDIAGKFLDEFERVFKLSQWE